MLVEGGLLIKKLTAILLAALLCCLMPTYAAAAAQSDGITWSVDGTTLIIGGSGAIPDYGNPSYNIEKKPLAPWYGMDIERVIIQQGVTRIGSFAFKDMESIVSIEIPESVSSVGHYAFSWTNITQMVFPSPVRPGQSVFVSSELRSVVFRQPVSIEAAAFDGNFDFQALHLPDQSGSIEYWAFLDSNLRAIWIPGGTEVSPGAFYVTADLIGGYPFRMLTVYGESGSSAERGVRRDGDPVCPPCKGSQPNPLPRSSGLSHRKVSGCRRNRRRLRSKPSASWASWTANPLTVLTRTDR